jgi:hypothetical protein
MECRPTLQGNNFTHKTKNFKCNKICNYIALHVKLHVGKQGGIVFFIIFFWGGGGWGGGQIQSHTQFILKCQWLK